MEVDNGIPYVNSQHDIAYALTTVKKNSILTSTLRTANIDHLIGQWVVLGWMIDNKDYKKAGMSKNGQTVNYIASERPYWSLQTPKKYVTSYIYPLGIL